MGQEQTRIQTRRPSSHPPERAAEGVKARRVAEVPPEKKMRHCVGIKSIVSFHLRETYPAETTEAVKSCGGHGRSVTRKIESPDSGQHEFAIPEFPQLTGGERRSHFQRSFISDAGTRYSRTPSPRRIRYSWVAQACGW